MVLVMLHPYNTARELEKTLEDVRRGELGIVEKIEASHSRNFTLLRLMLDRKPSGRPSAKEVLEMMNK